MEFRLVLRPAGRLFSAQHPTASLAWYAPPSVFGVHYVEGEWTGFGGEPITVPDYYRSFEKIVNPVPQTGFRIHRVTETKPIAALRDLDPDAYAKYSQKPTFMVIETRIAASGRTTKPDADGDHGGGPPRTGPARCRWSAPEPHASR